MEEKIRHITSKIKKKVLCFFSHEEKEIKKEKKLPGNSVAGSKQHFGIHTPSIHLKFQKFLEFSLYVSEV